MLTMSGPSPHYDASTRCSDPNASCSRSSPFVSGLIYVWFAAVRAVPEVRRRKEAAATERAT